MAETKFQSQEASMWNLEMQIGQLANMIADTAQGTLPSNTERNPREYIMAITLREAKQIVEKNKQEDHSSPLGDIKEIETIGSDDRAKEKKPEVTPYKQEDYEYNLSS